MVIEKEKQTERNWNELINNFKYYFYNNGKQQARKELIIVFKEILDNAKNKYNTKDAIDVLDNIEQQIYKLKEKNNDK